MRVVNLVLKFVRLLAIAFLLLSLPSVIQAQSSTTDIIGWVVDAHTGAPIPDAVVQVGQQATMSTVDGHFHIQNVQVEAPYSLLTVTVDGDDAGRWVMQDAVLYPDVIRNLGRIELDGSTQFVQSQLPTALRPLAEEDQQAVQADSVFSDGFVPQVFSHEIIPPIIRVGITGHLHCSEWLNDGSPMLDVVEMPFSDYVKGVLANEWVATWDIEALRAGAMAVKMFGWWRINLDVDGIRPEGAHVVDNTCDQVYRANSGQSTTDAAVDDTWNLIMRDDGRVIEIHYLSTDDNCERYFTGFRCMGQWGSKALADDGADWQTILHHYYDPVEMTLGTTNLPTMPANTDLVRNGDFSDGYANWLRFGDVTRALYNGVMAFKRDGSGSDGGVFYSFPYTVPTGTTLEVVLELGNSSNLTKTADVRLHDSTGSFSCQFIVPPNTPVQPYVLRGSAGASWSIPRLEIRPNADNSPDLLLDNVELYYRPDLSLNQTGCYGPSTDFAWDMTSGPQGWTILSGLTNPRQHINGGTAFDIVSDEPLLASPVMIDVQAETLNMLAVQLASSENTCVRVYFQTEADPVQVDIDVEADGAKHTYFIEMNEQPGWTGSVTRMYVQPMCDVNQGGTFRLLGIGLTNDTDILRLLAPQNVITDGYGNPVYRWNEMNGATHYQFFVADEFNQEVIHTVLEPSYCVDGECQIDATLLDEAYRLQNGEYQVYLRAWYDQNPGTWAGPFEFTLKAAPPAPPSITTPSKTDTSRPHFNWTLTDTAANAIWFRVVLADDDTLLVDEWFKRVEYCDDAGLCSVPSPVDLVNGNYDLYVRSWGRVA